VQNILTQRLTRSTSLALALATLLWLLLARALPAEAGGQVNNCSNDVEFTTALGGGGSVTFNCGTATITLASTKTITQNTTIDGGNVITLSGGGVRRLLIVNSGATLTLMNITIRDGASGASDGGAVFVNGGGGLTIVGSRFYSNTTSSSQGGGAITSYGALNLSGSEFAYNKAGGGGALNTVFGGAVTVISNSSFHHNETLSAHGGAIYIRDAAPMSLSQVTLSNNRALNQGGAIFVSGVGSSLLITDSQVLSNTSQSGGGGIYSQGALEVISSTIAHNNADSVGGGLSVESSATLSGTTVYSNTSFAGGGGLNAAATASLGMVNSEVSENYTYGGDGGGIRSLGNLVLTDTFVVRNIADAGPGDTYGGGIYHQTGRFSLIGNVSSNRAKHGAAINLDSGTAVIRSSFIAFNRAVAGDGGAIHNASSSALLDNSTIFGNTADNNGGGIFNQGTLTVTQTSISINHVSNNGGGIFQLSGRTTLVSSTVDSNETLGFGVGSGGGVYNAGGMMTLFSSMVDWNVANYRGAGLLNFDTLTLDRTLVRNNISYGGDSGLSTYGGGGIYNFGNATVVSSTLRDNQTDAQDGGGFYNGWYANATLTNVTLSNNHAAQNGGGLKNNLGIATLTNVTFSGNSAGNGNSGDGGGVFSDHGQTNLRHVTLSGNWAFKGGGIYNLTVYSTRTVSLMNTIIANSLQGYNCVSTDSGSLNVVSQQFNLSDDGSFDGGFCPAFGVNDQSYTNPDLGVLANHGGAKVGPDLEPMLTHLPRPGSPAIDKIPSGFNGCGNTFQSDQRGVHRPYNAYCDIGAVEYVPGDTTPWLWLPLIVR
jgi:predicted outer membrane repeat protein